MTVGLFLLSMLGVATGTLASSIYMFVLGIGIGLVLQVLVIAVQNVVPYSDLGAATSGATFFRSIGGSFGTAVLAVILEAAIATHPGALVGAFHVAFWWSVGFSAVAVVLSLWLPGVQRAPEVSRGSASDQQPDPVEV